MNMYMAPPWGLSTPRAPKYYSKNKMVAKSVFFLQICTIFCMRETVYISDGFRMRAGP